MADSFKLQVADVLDRAHDVLLTGGWCQEWMEKSSGEHCAAGAVCALFVGLRDRHGQLVVPSFDENPVACAALNALSWTTIHEYGMDVIHWNDADDRTLDDVLDLFRRTAKKLREQ